jgi:hypothetical protein
MAKRRDELIEPALLLELLHIWLVVAHEPLHHVDRASGLERPTGTASAGSSRA